MKYIRSKVLKNERTMGLNGKAYQFDADGVCEMPEKDAEYFLSISHEFSEVRKASDVINKKDKLEATEKPESGKVEVKKVETEKAEMPKKDESNGKDNKTQKKLKSKEKIKEVIKELNEKLNDDSEDDEKELDLDELLKS